MNIKELKEAIKELPDDMEVILEKDSEGNGFSPLAEIDTDIIYLANSSYSGEVRDTRWSTEDSGYESEEEWEEMKRKPRCCLLSPIN